MTFKQVLVQFIPPFVLTINRRLRELREKKTSEYKIGVHKILIPSNYCLPGFQKEYKLYDRFLPVLAKHLNTSDSIIDVGANIGDTTVSIAQNCNNPILCVEPSKEFLPFLKKNTNLINLKDNNRIKIINSFAGTGMFTGEIVHSSWGTASLNIEVETKENTHSSLDSLVSDSSKVSLIKVDTDGFDFDVLKSAKSTLKNSEPILFWENQMFEEFQLTGYDELYELLIKYGYSYIYVFDNYGNLMLEETDFKTLKNLNTYIFSMEKNNCTRSLYYTDVLASTKKNHLIIKKAISEYKKEFIFK